MESLFICEVFIEKPHNKERHGNLFNSLKEVTNFKNKFLNQKFIGNKLHGYISKIHPATINTVLEALKDPNTTSLVDYGVILEEFTVTK